MIKFVLLGAVVLLVVWLLRGVRGSAAPRTPPAAEPPKSPPAAQGEEMVACLRCGVHLPRSEALPGRGGFFCGEAHRLEHERAQSVP